MKNKDGSTLMIVMMAFTFFALLATALSFVFFMNLRLRINKIEDRALYIELANGVYNYLNEKNETTIAEGSEEFGNYTVQITSEGENFKIIFTNSENDRIKAEIIVSFQEEIYEIISWRKN